MKTFSSSWFAVLLGSWMGAVGLLDSHAGPDQVPHPKAKKVVTVSTNASADSQTITHEGASGDSRTTDKEEAKSEKDETGPQEDMPEIPSHFEHFTVGQTVYTNVHVLQRTSTDVFMRHQSGLANIKVEELSEEQLETLGYAVKKRKTVGPIASILSETITKARTPEGMAELTGKVTAVLPENYKMTPEELQTLLGQISSGHLPKPALVAVSVVFVTLPLIYFFLCYTSRMICEKAGVKPGPMIWLPLVSSIPLAKAAGLPGWSGLLFYVPLINTVYFIVWSFKICTARSKSAVAALCLICPLTSPGAWLYLAYSK